MNDISLLTKTVSYTENDTQNAEMIWYINIGNLLWYIRITDQPLLTDIDSTWRLLCTVMPGEMQL